MKLPGKQVDTSTLAFANPSSSSQAVTEDYQDRKLFVLGGWGCLAAPAVTSLRFLDFANNRDVSQAELSSFVAMPVSGTITKLQISCGTALTTDTVGFTIRINGTTTAVSVSLPPSTSTVLTTGLSLSFNAGDRISMAVQQTGTQAQANWAAHVEISYETTTNDAMPIAADARDYYVSAFTGSDTNPGTQAQPWRTARKCSNYTFQAGFKVRFERGGTYAGPFIVNGNGVFAKTTFDTTYASALATAITTLNGDGTRAAYHAALITDGFTDPTANTLSDQFIAGLAASIARKAAFAAADSASTWLTIEAYGSGVNPIIQSPSTAYGGIWLGYGSTYTGGIKVLNVDVDGALVSCILYDPGPRHTNGTATTSNAFSPVGTWLEGCRLTNATGMAIKTTGFPYPGPISPYMQFCGAGVTMMFPQYLMMKSVEIDHCDAFAFLWSGTQVHIESNHVHHSYIGTFYVQGISKDNVTVPLTDGLSIESMVMDHVCYAANPSAQGPGFFKGESGPLLANSRNITITNLQVNGVPLIHADGVAIDLEGITAGDWGTVVISGGTLSNCEGTGFLQNDAGSHVGSTFLFDGIAMTLNRTTSGQPPVPAISPPAIYACRTTVTDTRVFTRCFITRGSNTQNLFGGDATDSYTPTYNTPPTGMSVGPSNTVTP